MHKVAAVRSGVSYYLIHSAFTKILLHTTRETDLTGQPCVACRTATLLHKRRFSLPSVAYTCRVHVDIKDLCVQDWIIIILSPANRHGMVTGWTLHSYNTTCAQLAMETHRSKLHSTEIYQNITTVIYKYLYFNMTHNTIITENLVKQLVLKSIMAGQDQHTHFFGFNNAVVLNVKLQ